MSADELLDKVKDLGLQRILIAGGAFCGIAVLLFMLLSRFGAQDLAPLYNGIDPEDSSKVLEHLSSQGIQFEVRDGGIYVPKETLLRARMSLAESGIPGGSLVGYEIFDKSDVLGSTHFVQNVNLLRALEGELARTIQTIQSVAQARIHIVMPERKLFTKDKRQPSAAVVVRMRQSRRLESSQVQAIRNLVASSVPDLKLEHVSILDDRGTLLASGAERDANNVPMEAEEMRVVYEARLARMIESMLEQSLGVGSVRAEVSAEIDYDRITEQSEVFDPDGQVIRSQQNMSDSNRENGGAQGATGVQQEVPNMQRNQAGGGGQGSEGQKSEETTNYEISKTIKTAVKEMGGIKRLSVAVMVDGVHQKDDQGEAKYEDRSAEEMKKIKRLVQAAMGYSEERGDVVDVVNLRFQKPEELPDAPQSWVPPLSQDHWMRLLEMALLGILVLALFFFGIRPVLMARLAVKEAEKAAEAQQAEELMPGVKGGEAAEALEVGQMEETLKGWEKLPDNELLDLVEKFVAEDPERAASVLRVWMKG